MKPTNEERREVAERLRDNAEKHPGMKLILSVGFACDALRPRGAMEWDVTSHDAAVYLADLIEPEPERTCSAEERYYYDDSSPWPYYVCSECGERIQCREVVEADGDQYYELMPYCAGCGAKVVDE